MKRLLLILALFLACGTAGDYSTRSCGKGVVPDVELYGYVKVSIGESMQISFVEVE